MKAYLSGREEALGPLGWSGRRAEWITVVCLNGGYFTKPQLAAYYGIADENAQRHLRMLQKGGIMSGEILAGRKVCRIFGRETYRALGVPDLRPRPDSSEETVVRRLLALDYVLDHDDLPWLPTAAEKVETVGALGIAPELVPSRYPGGRGNPRRRYFPDHLPIALDGRRALFVFTDPGFASVAPLRRWGAAHRILWDALRARGRAIHVVVVGRTVEELRRARAPLAGWSRPGNDAAGAAGREASREIGRIKRAIVQGDRAALAPYGDIRGGLNRISDLREIVRHARPWPTVDAVDTWRSTRLPGEWS